MRFRRVQVSWPRMSRRRWLRAAAATTLLVGATATSALAATDTISNNQWVSPQPGVSGPAWHALSRVYVHDLGGGYGACEDALNTGGSWAQDSAWCTIGGEMWHDFCQCQSRLGFNWSFSNTFNELMNGHQNY
jgi:hypothetical protein